MKMQRQDWLSLGLKVLTRQGITAVKIDALCQRAGTSKGSFYHHFEHRDDYLTALLDYWQFYYSRYLIEQVENLPDWQQRQVQLNELLDDEALAIEAAIRHWAWQDSSVQAIVEQADQQRLQYLIRQCQGLFGEHNKAEVLANLVYWHFIGCVQAGSRISQALRQSMDQLLIDMALSYGEKQDG